MVHSFKVLLQQTAFTRKQRIQYVLRTIRDLNRLINHAIDVEPLVLIDEDP
jgi:hypothetical protein